MYGRSKPLNNSDDEDFNSSRYSKSLTSRSYGSNNNIGLSSARNNNEGYYPPSARSTSRRDSFGRDDDTKKYGAYRNNKTGNEFDTSDDDFKYNAKYNEKQRHHSDHHRHHSDSDDEFDKRRTHLSSSNSKVRPLSSAGRREDKNYNDNGSFDSAHQKLKMMIQYDKNLCEQLDEIYEEKLAKEKKIEQLKDEMHRDTIKEDNIRKKLSEIRIERKMLQAKLVTWEK